MEFDIWNNYNYILLHFLSYNEQIELRLIDICWVLKINLKKNRKKSFYQMDELNEKEK